MAQQTKNVFEIDHSSALEIVSEKDIPNKVDTNVAGRITDIRNAISLIAALSD